MSRPFEAGDVCLLVDARGRTYLVDLTPGAVYQYHGGTLSHDAVIDQPDGTSLWTSNGARLVALRPRLSDYILRMKRGAQVVYPKDVGPILMWGDIGAGMSVLESGTGSGALAMALARAVGPTGRVVSIERREDHAAHARRVIERFFGAIPPQLELRIGEVEDAAAEVAHDRLVLDIPEPWHVLEAGVHGCADGGVATVYVPTVPQVMQTQDAMRRSRRFFDIETFEVIQREWNAEGRSVRPSFQMVGHTGFITVARHTPPLPKADDTTTE